MDLVWLAGFIF